MLEHITISTVLLVVGDFLTVYLYRYMQKSFYEKRSWAVKYRLLYILVYVIDALLLLGANLIGFPPLNLASCILCYLIPMFLCYQVNTWRGVVYFMFYLIGVIGMEVIMGASLGYLNNDMGLTARYDILTPEVSVVMNILEILLVFAICKYANKDRDKRIGRVSLIFMAMPLVSVSLIIADVFQLAMGRVQNFNSDQFMRSTLLLLVVNVVIFIILERYTEIVRREIDLTGEKIKAQSEADIMEMAAGSMRERLAIAEQVLQQDRIMRHDRRHFEALLLSLLEDDRIEEARKCLEERLEAEPKNRRKYCDNTTVNAAIAHYMVWAEKEEIQTHVSANIPEQIHLDDLELAITISNLLENAIHACQKVSGSRYIRMTARYKEQLILEVENSCPEDVKLDEEGYPKTSDAGHGIGTRSILAFVEKVGGTITYQVENHVFRVRMIVGE